jgi:hypothetical protein
MDVPRRFKLFGIQYTVEVIPPIRWKRSDCVGYLDQNRAVIHIKKGAADVNAQTFWHEIAHLTLTSANREDLSEDEGLVDLLASMIHQVIATSQE